MQHQKDYLTPKRNRLIRSICPVAVLPTCRPADR